MSLQNSWGIQPEEKMFVFPCDNVDCNFDKECSMYRAVTINAPATEIYQWLGQLRFTSLSYELNGKSKRNILRSSLYNQQELRINQTVMDIFDLISFEKDVQMTLSIKPDSGYPMGCLVASYMIKKQEEKKCRLLFKANMRFKESLMGYLAKKLLPWGDLLMMRKQLLTIKQLAERQDTIDKKII